MFSSARSGLVKKLNWLARLTSSPGWVSPKSQNRRLSKAQPEEVKPNYVFFGPRK